jgi:hypothetical protein
MKQIESWPPPDWTEVIVKWDDVLSGPEYPIRAILDWIESAPGGDYHLHGYNAVEGFSFRFEQAEDAVYFKLRWL